MAQYGPLALRGISVRWRGTPVGGTRATRTETAP
jgi:hypothetical protein